MKRFLELLKPTVGTRILDVGGSIQTWTGIPVRPDITVLNTHTIEYARTPAGPRINTVVGDGCNLHYPSDSFDIVFSNSVIEHVGSFERQQKFAEECSRMAPTLWIQTPARSFFMESHLLTPFIHFFPRHLQRALLRNFTVWGLLERPSTTQVEAFLDEVRLLTYREMKLLFSDCDILREKICGFTKSYIAVRGSVS